MLALGILAALIVAQSGTNPLPACSGSPVAIDSVVSSDVQNDGDMERYALRGTVTNHGTRKQASNVLQSIEVFQDSQKINEIGIPPLGAGRPYSFRQRVVRSALAGDGTTHLSFRLEMHRPSNCTEGSTYHLRV
jgi:hypothetical protein